MRMRYLWAVAAALVLPLGCGGDEKPAGGGAGGGGAGGGQHGAAPQHGGQHGTGQHAGGQHGGGPQQGSGNGQAKIETGGHDIGQPVAAPELELIETQYIPDEAFVAVVVHPQSILDSELFKEYVTAEDAQQLMQQIQQDAGVDPKTAQRVTVISWAAKPAAPTDEPAEATPTLPEPETDGQCGQAEEPPAGEEPFPAPGGELPPEFGPGPPQGGMPFNPDQPAVAIVRFSQPVDLANIKGENGKGLATWEEVTEGDVTYRRSPEGEGIGAAYQPDPQVLVIAEKEEYLKAALSASGNGPLAVMLQQAELTHAISVVLQMEGVRDQLQMAAMMAGQQPDENLDKLESATIHVDAGSGVRIRIHLNAIDEATAQEMLSETQKALNQARLELPKAEESAAMFVGPEIAPQLIGIAQATLDSAELNTEGQVFMIQVSLTRDTIASIVAVAKPLFQQFGGMMLPIQPGGPPEFPPPTEEDSNPPSLPEPDSN